MRFKLVLTFFTLKMHVYRINYNSNSNSNSIFLHSNAKLKFHEIPNKDWFRRLGSMGFHWILYSKFLNMIFHSPPIKVMFKNSSLPQLNPLHTKKLELSFCSCMKIGQHCSAFVYFHGTNEAHAIYQPFPGIK